MAVLLDGDPAAARGDDNRLGAGLDLRPPRSTVGLDGRERALLLVGMVGHRPATAAAGDAYERDADAIEDPRGRGVDHRRERPLHAAPGYDHSPRVTRVGLA